MIQHAHIPDLVPDLVLYDPAHVSRVGYVLHADLAQPLTTAGEELDYLSVV